MPTLTQLSIRKKGRLKKIKKCKTKALKGSPHRFGVALKIYTTSPKKPNSAVRKVVKVKLSTGRKVIVAIPGQGHNIRVNTAVMIRGKGFKDVPGVKYKIIRGKLGVNLKENFVRKRARSKYNLPRDSGAIY